MCLVFFFIHVLVAHVYKWWGYLTKEGNCPFFIQLLFYKYRGHDKMVGILQTFSNLFSSCNIDSVLTSLSNSNKSVTWLFDMYSTYGEEYPEKILRGVCGSIGYPWLRKFWAKTYPWLRTFSWFWAHCYVMLRDFSSNSPLVTEI